MKKIILICCLIPIVIIIGVILYVDYNMKLNESLRIIRVPVAIYDIEKELVIREDMLTFIEVSSNEIDENTYIKTNDIIGKISTKRIKTSEKFTVNNIK